MRTRTWVQLVRSATSMQRCRCRRRAEEFLIQAGAWDRLFPFDASRADDAGETLRILLHETREFRGRTGAWLRTLNRQALRNIGHREHRTEPGVELVDDGAR